MDIKDWKPFALQWVSPDKTNHHVNAHPYVVSIGRYQKLGRLYQVEESVVQGARDLSLTTGPDGVVEVGVVEISDLGEEENPTEEVSKLMNHPDLTQQQQIELC